jgi:hypothetical protein
MSKKMIVLALSVVSAAMFALPAAASANFLHISNGTETFTIKGGTGTVSTASGTTIHCAEVTGSGKYETTTTGTLQITLGPTCTTTLFGVTDHCQSEAQGAPHNFATETGIIRSTTLPFHLVTDENKVPALLLTPNASGAFAHIECETTFGNISFTITGNGVLGKIKTPACGAKSKTSTLDMNATAHGVQELTKVTGVTYGGKKEGENAALDVEATATYAGEPTLTCT